MPGKVHKIYTRRLRQFIKTSPIPSGRLALGSPRLWLRDVDEPRVKDVFTMQIDTAALAALLLSLPPYHLSHHLSSPLHINSAEVCLGNSLKTHKCNYKTESRQRRGLGGGEGRRKAGRQAGFLRSDDRLATRLSIYCHPEARKQLNPVCQMG